MCVPDISRLIDRRHHFFILSVRHLIPSSPCLHKVWLNPSSIIINVEEKWGKEAEEKRGKEEQKKKRKSNGLKKGGKRYFFFFSREERGRAGGKNVRDRWSRRGKKGGWELTGVDRSGTFGTGFFFFFFSFYLAFSNCITFCKLLKLLEGERAEWVVWPWKLRVTSH